MRIDVTFGDIWFGKRQNFEECMIARALKKRGLSVDYVLAEGCSINKKWFRFNSAVSARINRFDEYFRLFVFPFSFDLPIPEAAKEGSKWEERSKEEIQEPAITLATPVEDAEPIRNLPMVYAPTAWTNLVDARI